MKQRENYLLKITLGFLFLGIGCYLLLGIINADIEVGIKREVTPVINIYSVTDMTSNFELLWTKQPFAIAAPEHWGNILLVSNFNKAYILLSRTGATTAIDLEKGEEEDFNFVRYKAIPGPIASTIGINADSLFIGFESTQKIESRDMTWGAAKIEAYDRVSGILQWSQVIPGASSINMLFVTEDTISIDGGASSNYYLLDAKTGAIIQSNPTTLVWKIEDDLVYKKAFGGDFQLYNRGDDEIIWESEIFGTYQPPIFSDSRIITKSGTDVIALDTSNGQNIWEYSQLFSNVAVNDNIAYFVTDKGSLLAIDITSGDLLGNIQFTSPPDNNPQNVFHVTASNNIVLIHTGYAGNQLFAFRFVP